MCHDIYINYLNPIKSFILNLKFILCDNKFKKNLKTKIKTLKQLNYICKIIF